MSRKGQVDPMLCSKFCFEISFHSDLKLSHILQVYERYEIKYRIFEKNTHSYKIPIQKTIKTGRYIWKQLKIHYKIVTETFQSLRISTNSRLDIQNMCNKYRTENELTYEVAHFYIFRKFRFLFLVRPSISTHRNRCMYNLFDDISWYLFDVEFKLIWMQLVKNFKFIKPSCLDCVNTFLTKSAFASNYKINWNMRNDIPMN